MAQDPSGEVRPSTRLNVADDEQQASGEAETDESSGPGHDSTRFSVGSRPMRSMVR